MDILSIIGLILAVGMVLFGIMFDSDTTRVVLGNLHAFWDYPSLAITIGGTIGGIIGGKLLNKISDKFLQIFFILFLLYAGINNII